MSTFKFDDNLMSFVRRNIQTGKIPMLVGEPGIGKSSWVENLAALLHTKCFTFACNQLADKSDVTGCRLVPGATEGDYRQVFFPHIDIVDAIEYAEANPNETPILFMDEINRTSSDVTSELLSIPTARRIGNRRLPANLKVIIAGNDKGAVTALDEASVSRFILYHVAPDVNTFMAVNPTLNPYIKTVLTQHPDAIFCKHTTLAGVQVGTAGDDDDDATAIEEILDDGESMQQITTPRTITALSEFLNTFNAAELRQLLATAYISDGVETNLLAEAVNAHVGDTLFSQLLLGEISVQVMNSINNNNAGASATIIEPVAYAQLKNAQDMTTLMNVASTLSEQDASACMVWALYERPTNVPVIQTLAPRINTLQQTDLQALLKLAANGQMERDGIEALFQTNTPLAESVQILGSIVS